MSTQTISINLAASSGTPRGNLDLKNVDTSPIAAPISHELPPAIGAGQAYYWSYTWQRGEQRVSDELARGLGRTFDNVQDSIRWLLADDE